MRAVKITNKMLIASVGRYAAAQEWRGVSLLSTLEKLMKGWLIMGPRRPVRQPQSEHICPVFSAFTHHPPARSLTRSNPWEDSKSSLHILHTHMNTEPAASGIAARLIALRKEFHIFADVTWPPWAPWFLGFGLLVITVWGTMILHNGLKQPKLGLSKGAVVFVGLLLIAGALGLSAYMGHLGYWLVPITMIWPMLIAFRDLIALAQSLPPRQRPRLEIKAGGFSITFNGDVQTPAEQRSAPRPRVGR